MSVWVLHAFLGYTLTSTENDEGKELVDGTTV